MDAKSLTSPVPRLEMTSAKPNGMIEGAMDWNQAVVAVPLNPGITNAQTKRPTDSGVSSFPSEKSFVNSSSMSIAEFVSTKFVPEHVASKTGAGRRHYQAILKHVLTPERVDKMFGVETDVSKSKLKRYANWPYIDEVRISDTRPDHVQHLVRAALENGYSAQTAKHIRNVVSAILTHAIRERYFTGENPARLVALPEMIRKESHSLNLSQTISVLKMMQYPEREMSLIAVLTNMNMSEICGLQWKNVNLTQNIVNREGEAISPKTIAVRRQWHRGELCDVRKGRKKDIDIHPLLFSVLLGLSRRNVFNGWSDFVLTSKTGTPINQINIAARRLKAIGRELQMPWLSWQVFRRTHTSLAYGFSMEAQHELSKVVASSTPQGLRVVSAPPQQRS
jgi:integrase